MATKTYWFKADHTDATTGLTWRAGVTDRVTDTDLQGRLVAATGPAGEKVVIDLADEFLSVGDLGTSGAKIPLLNAANTWGAAQIITDLDQSVVTGVNHSFPVSSGTAPAGSPFRIGAGNTALVLDAGISNTGGLVGAWLQSTFADDLSQFYALSLNPLGGQVRANGHAVWHAGNTTVDGSGFIKQASPIVRVGAGVDEGLGFREAGDGAVNGRAAGVQIEKTDTGIYEISGTLGLAQQGWQIEVPKDHNGNLLCHAEVDFSEGVITVSVSEPVFDQGRWTAGAAMDIPQGRWVDLRLHESPEAAVPPPVEDGQERTLTARHIYAERDRRLALGFDYDFGDDRGVHKIGTTEADLRGWNEVTTAFGAADKLSIALTLTIMTETGPAQVNSAEWAAILLQSATVRQAIWAASFALQESDPIPDDYTNDIHWGGGA